ncbi:MAG: hypothetical protein HYV60_04190 [Planctomycetia bacterium]|nr:hypothetical protein [Planctomycetia bacterium]
MPVDVVEKRRAQLEAKNASPKPAPTPPRSKIERPLSALVDLPDPEPPPIPAAAIEPVIKEQPKEQVEPSARPPKSGPSPDKTDGKAESSKKPPPLPKRREDRAKPTAKSVEPLASVDAVEDYVAPSLLPAVGSSEADTDPTIEPHYLEEFEADDMEIPVRGYEAGRDKVATVRWLAAAILITSFIGMVPAIIDVVEHSLSDTSDGVSRWACGLLLVGVLQCAYAVYLVQLPDWSSVGVVTCFTLAIAASYAAMFGLTLMSSDQGHFVQLLDLADRLRGGKATAWCLIMLSLMSLTSYFSGRVGARWRNTFIG